MRNLVCVLLALALSPLGGCGSPRPGPGPDNPTCHLDKYYVDDVFEQRHVYLRMQRQLRSNAAPPGAEPPLETTNILELSAGGEYGAYGAGFLVGWGSIGKAGKPISRDDVHIVTGVSTGSIMATYAFIGGLDEQLRELYENIDDKAIYTPHTLLGLIRANSLFDTSGKHALIWSRLDDKTLEKVAAAAGTGRYLYIGIANLDTGEFKRIDMVRLASDSGNPLRYNCYRSVIDASSAIEVAFEPVFIDGKMFGDGGVRRHLFLVSPEAMQAATQRNDLSSHLFRALALIHGDLEVGTQQTKNGVLPIADRAASIFTDQVMKDSVRLSNALVTDPASVVGPDVARRMPKFTKPLYAAAAARACQCKKQPQVVSQCQSSRTTSGADIFCKPYMQCLSKYGVEDGKQYASTGDWLPYEKLNLGTGPTCDVPQAETYRTRPMFR